MSATTKVSSTGAAELSLVVDVQYALGEGLNEEPPSADILTDWARKALGAIQPEFKPVPEVTIRLVDESEIKGLNLQYRNKDKATNVLSFPFSSDFPEIGELALNLLGDIVICHSVIVSEAQNQHKQIMHHYAHMVTHGVLHLCGYDHEQEAAANEMEALEIAILAQSNIANPYTEVSVNV